MPRRLVPLSRAHFVTTLSIDDPETGEIKQHKFHSKGSGRTWERIKEQAGKESINPSSDVTNLLNWTKADVNDGGNVFSDQTVSFSADYSTYALTVARVLQIEESSSLDVHNVQYQAANGDVRLVRFNEDELDEDFFEVVKVNLSGAAQWLVTVGVKKRRLKATLTGLDALVSYTQDVGSKWVLTPDLGTF